MSTDPNVVRDLFASHYFLFAFLASLGTLQIAVSNAGTRGLWLIPHARLTRWLGIALILAGIAIFFLQPIWIDGPWAAGSVEADSLTREWGKASWAEFAGARNVNDIDGGLDGTKQAIWFPLAAILAFAVSAVVGTLSIKVLTRGEQSDTSRPPVEIADGLEGLANRSYFSNFLGSLRRFRLEIVDLWCDGLKVADRWSLMKTLFGRSSK